MFARTERLTLRPGWIEDAPALARAIGDERVVRNLARAPWPYALSDAQWWLSQPVAAHVPNFLIFAHDRGTTALVGGIGIVPLDGAPAELGYWITPDVWGRGYATEAGGAVLAIATMLGIDVVTSGHFVDNPASGAVLRKLGFTPTGQTVPTAALARGETVATIRFARTLTSAGPPLDCAAA